MAQSRTANITCVEHLKVNTYHHFGAESGPHIWVKVATSVPGYTHYRDYTYRVLSPLEKKVDFAQIGMLPMKRTYALEDRMSAY